MRTPTYIVRPTTSVPFVAGLLALVSAILRPLARRADRQTWDATVRQACERLASKRPVARLVGCGIAPAVWARPMPAAVAVATTETTTETPAPAAPTVAIPGRTYQRPTTSQRLASAARKPRQPRQTTDRPPAPVAQTVEPTPVAFVADPTPTPVETTRDSLTLDYVRVVPTTIDQVVGTTIVDGYRTIPAGVHDGIETAARVYVDGPLAGRLVPTEHSSLKELRALCAVLGVKAARSCADTLARIRAALAARAAK